MRIVLWIALLSVVPAAAAAVEHPGWAFPTTDKIQPQTIPDDGKPKAAPGGSRTNACWSFSAVTVAPGRSMS